MFEPITFNPGLNVVLGEIRLPQNKDKDSHNLGKTTLGKLIDFCLLRKKSSAFFLFKHLDLFSDFIFFLEIKLSDNTFLTIRRNVEEATKISIKKHEVPNQDFSSSHNNIWDHSQLAFEPAKELVDGLLNLQAIKPWGFRKEMGYLIRSQNDYQNVFQLQKFASAHADWKPFLAHILGFDAELIQSHYKLKDTLEKEKAKANIIKAELGGTLEDVSKIEGILLLKRRETEKKQSLLNSFDFNTEDKNKIKELVDEINIDIAKLNSEKYSLTQNRKKITSSIEEDQILFDPDEAQKIFHEAGISFQGQIKKDFEQLIEFNKAITEERQAYLKEELTDHDQKLTKINNEIRDLGERRSKALQFLSETNVLEKYKKLSNELVFLRADVETLERQRTQIARLQELRTKIRKLEEDVIHLQTKVEENVELQNANSESFFSSIRLYFSEIIEHVIDRKALLNVSTNRNGHLDFEAQILDQAGNNTSADMGHTYRKLLCVAFDLSILRAHLTSDFPRFTYHDGIFETLDPRKKQNLLEVVRDYCDLGVQHIITLIDSDLPQYGADEDPPISIEEVVLRLHDEGEEGRLFKMKNW